MKYKYVPCCYVNAQQDKKAFKSYYLGEDVEDDTSQQKFIKFIIVSLRHTQQVRLFFIQVLMALAA